MNIEGKEVDGAAALAALEPVDRWILSKLNSLIKEVTDNMEHFELGIAVISFSSFAKQRSCRYLGHAEIIIDSSSACSVQKISSVINGIYGCSSFNASINTIFIFPLQS